METEKSSSIEEIALEKYPVHISEYSNGEEYDFNESDRSTYIEGATDQLNIDIEKAVQWLYNCENIKVEGITWEEFLNNFKEAMEE